jgi:hypothetical protein
VSTSTQPAAPSTADETILLLPEQEHAFRAAARQMAEAKLSIELSTSAYDSLADQIEQDFGATGIVLPDASAEIGDRVAEAEGLLYEAARLIADVLVGKEDWEPGRLQEARDAVDRGQRRVRESCRDGLARLLAAAGIEGMSAGQVFAEIQEGVQRQMDLDPAESEEVGFSLVQTIASAAYDTTLILGVDRNDRLQVIRPALPMIEQMRMAEINLLVSLSAYSDRTPLAARVERDAALWTFERYAARREKEGGHLTRAAQWMFLDRPFLGLGKRTLVDDLIENESAHHPEARIALARAWSQSSVGLYWVDANDDGTARYERLPDAGAIPVYGRVHDENIREPHQKSGLAIGRVIPMGEGEHMAAMGSDFFPRVSRAQAEEVAGRARETESDEVRMPLAIEDAVARAVLKQSTPRRIRPSEGRYDAIDTMFAARDILWRAGLAKAEDGRSVETEGPDSEAPDGELEFLVDAALDGWIRALIEDINADPRPARPARSRGGKKQGKKGAKRRKSR